ncbi:hypothetical protein Y032_0015g2535 [Ancylostoma ceylanicum]|uniref:Uncharacterized protein n=1 Tax=Ancylostoma ceylanicum TaxID=53326 RepID=A0A016V6D4_9BILA|nr:hypothetical protein Y032_0015g2535 [Ancylostoma ceylanicum]
MAVVWRDSSGGTVDRVDLGRAITTQVTVGLAVTGCKTTLKISRKVHFGKIIRKKIIVALSKCMENSMAASRMALMIAVRWTSCWRTSKGATRNGNKGGSSASQIQPAYSATRRLATYNPHPTR